MGGSYGRLEADTSSAHPEAQVQMKAELSQVLVHFWVFISLDFEVRPVFSGVGAGFGRAERKEGWLEGVSPNHTWFH